jgi:hypothetical protein
MIYSKNINEITYQDVVDFCNEGHQESFILEYKSDFQSLANEKIAKTIASFANTYGGILILGVSAPNGKPIAPFDGFVFDPTAKYEEKIESVVLAHIIEPVFPEIKVCESKAGKTFIVIRVGESNLTPHRVANNSKIYIRTGQSSTPNSEATWDKIEWLALRRKKSEELRETIKIEADRYFYDCCKLRGIRLDDKTHYFANLSIGIIPQFPQEPLVPFRKLDEISRGIIVSDKHQGSFPLGLYRADTVLNGIRKLYVIGEGGRESVHGKPYEYSHINSFGLYLYKRDIGDIYEHPTKAEDGSIIQERSKRLYFYRLAFATHQAIASATKFYQQLGYWGSAQIVVELKNALGIRVLSPSRDPDFFDEEDIPFVPSDHLKWESIMSCTILQERLREEAKDIIENMAWSLGMRLFTADKIDKFLEENF